MNKSNFAGDTLTSGSAPIVCDFEETARFLRCGRSLVYELINEKKLDALKIGRKTLIIFRSIEALVAAAPRVGEAA